MKNIYDTIEKNNICIVEKDIKHNAYFMDVENTPIIILNKHLKGNSENLVVAEEVAHYCVGVTPSEPFNDDYHNKLIRSRNEFRAFKWMQDKLIPHDIEKYKYNTLWEISEELGMPQEFIQKAIEYRKENNNG